MHVRGMRNLRHVAYESQPGSSSRRKCKHLETHSKSIDRLVSLVLYHRANVSSMTMPLRTRCRQTACTDYKQQNFRIGEEVAKGRNHLRQPYKEETVRVCKLNAKPRHSVDDLFRSSHNTVILASGETQARSAVESKQA
jgi:hypothetical protein